MNTRILLTASAIVLGVMGAATSFLPVEILSVVDAGSDRSVATLVQLLGAALFGFAMLNWMARGAPAGGIYGRPIVIGNLVHFSVAGIALAKVAAVGGMPKVGLVLAAVYAGFAIAFTVVMFGPGPLGRQEP
ncbi:hypothetical protein BH24ACI5_BH24ACI5_05740 [soil metagenome]